MVVLVFCGALGIATLGLWLFADHMQNGAITADWPWLYRTGQAIWANGLPHQDLWSWTFAQRHWVLYQWLFEVVAAPIYSALGLPASVIAVSLFGAAVYILLPALYLQRRGVHPLWTIAIGALVLIPVSTNLGLRPMLASNLALLAQFVVIQRLRAHRLAPTTACAAVAVIYALWANSHLGFTLGLLSLLLFAAGDVWTRRRAMTRVGRTLPVYAALGAVAMLASGLNPYGWTLYSYIGRLSLESRMNAHIHELMPPDPHNPYMLVGAGLIAIFVLLAALYRRLLDAAEIGHVVAFCGMTMGSMRFVVWAGLFYVLVAPRLFQHAGGRLTPRSIGAALRPLSARPLSRFSIAALTILAIGVAALGAPWTAGNARLARCGPLRDALLYFDAHHPPDTHWFSSEIAGSCARIYTPDRRVFIDTRFDMYPESFVVNWFQAYQYRHNWQALFKRWRIRDVVLARGAPLVPTLNADPAYRVSYHDPHALIFERGPWVTAPAATAGRKPPVGAD